MCAKIKAAVCLLMSMLALCGCAESVGKFPYAAANSLEAISTSAPERKHTMQKTAEGEKLSFEVSASSFELWTATGVWIRIPNGGRSRTEEFFGMPQRIKSCRITITLKQAGLRPQRSLITAFGQTGGWRSRATLPFPRCESCPTILMVP